MVTERIENELCFYENRKVMYLVSVGCSFFQIFTKFLHLVNNPIILLILCLNTYLNQFSCSFRHDLAVIDKSN